MSLTILQTKTAIVAGLSASFQGYGGTEPYTYSVAPGGAGGTVNSTTGVYQGPAAAPTDPKLSSDRVIVTDSLAATASASILVTSHLGLLADILQKSMGLSNGRVYLWDQKIMQPTDSDLYIAVCALNPKPFGVSRDQLSDDVGLYEVLSVNMLTAVTIDIISRGPAARDRKEEIILALNSTYSEQQQEANSFSIGNLSTNFINLSQLDGAAIPYRYQITCNMQYFVKKVNAIQFYDDFEDVVITTED